jgi:hypothetical protein
MEPRILPGKQAKPPAGTLITRFSKSFRKRSGRSAPLASDTTHLSNLDCFARPARRNFEPFQSVSGKDAVSRPGGGHFGLAPRFVKTEM